MLTRVSKKGFCRFLRETAGNVAVTAALMAAPITLTLGGAVDLMRYASARAELQGAIDSGILAAAALTNTRSVDLVVKDYLAANVDKRFLDQDSVKVTVKEEKKLNGRYVEVTASITLDTYFLALIGKDTMSVSATASGSQEFTSLEVALVLDISSSMNNNRLANLRTATHSFIDTVLTDDVKGITSVSIIPFGGTVNVGDDFLAYVDTSDADDDNDTNFSDGHKWNGCFELLPEDYSDDTFDLGFGTGREIVPHFWKYKNFNPWCPSSNNEAIFLSNNVTDLKNLVTGFTRSDGTGMDIGAAWGLKALSPELRGVLKGDFEDVRPTDYNGDTLKALVMMTDGGITAQHRPKQSGCIRAKNNDPNNTVNKCIEQLYEGTEDEQKGKKSVEYFDAICKEARDHNIIVYTIGFEITEGSNQDKYLSRCPQSVSQYYLVESTDIEEAFSAIAASINGIRLTM